MTTPDAPDTTPAPAGDTPTAPDPALVPADQAAVPVFSPDQWGMLLTLLGGNADDQADDVIGYITDLTTNEAAAAGQPSAIVAAAHKKGLEVLDGELVAKLRRDAAEGQKIKAKAASDRREGIVHAAISRGAITPGRRKHWLTLLEADPGMEQVLASTPAETAVPLREIGHTTGDGWNDEANLASYSPDHPGSRWVK